MKGNNWLQQNLYDPVGQKDRRLKSLTQTVVVCVCVPVLLVVLEGWDSGDVRLCLRPCSSDGEVGNDETGGVWALRTGSRVVVG